MENRRSGPDDDQRVVVPEVSSAFLRDAMLDPLAGHHLPGTIVVDPLRNNRASTTRLRGASFNQTPQQPRPADTAGTPLHQVRSGGDDSDGAFLLSNRDRPDPIATSFSESAKRVSMFRSGSATPSAGRSDATTARNRNQHVLEQLRLHEEARMMQLIEQRRLAAASPADSNADTTNNNNDDARSDATDPSTVLWGENYTYNLVATSFFILSPDSWLRRKLFFTIDHAYFERLVLFFIVVSIGGMILDTPGIREQPSVDVIITVMEIVFQVVFTLEMLIKMAALGVILHKYSYMRSAWNVADAAIVVFGFVAYGLDAQFRTLRLIRVFRLLRALGRVKQLHSISVALANSASRMADVALLMMFVTMTMAVLGLQFFVGSFQRRCYFSAPTAPLDTDVVIGLGGVVNLSNFINVSNPSHQWILDPLDNSQCADSTFGHMCLRGAECDAHREVWEDVYLNFDNIGTSVFYILKMVTMDNWPADDVRMQQAEGFGYFLFAFSIVIFGSFFCLNLILAILSSEYEDVVNEQTALEASAGQPLGETAGAPKVASGAQGLLVGVETVDEDEDEMQDLESDDGAPNLGDATNNDGGEYADSGPPQGKSIIRMIRDAAKALIYNVWFSRFILTVTSINVIALGCDHHQIDPTFSNVLDNINFTCSIIFLVEAFVKVVALLAKYFYDPFSVFDFILCCVSIPEMILSSGGSTFSALRAFRLARVVRVLNNSKTMRQLLLTVVDAARSSAFLFLFLALFLLTMAIFAVNFMTNSVEAGLRPNFATIADALLANFIVLTGENWVEIGITSMTGTSWFTALYFYPFYAVGNYLLLNFVIVILITSFNQASDRLREEEALETKRLQEEQATALMLLQMQPVEPAGSLDNRGRDDNDEGTGEIIAFVDLTDEGKSRDPSSGTPPPELGAKSTATGESPAGKEMSGQFSDGGEVVNRDNKSPRGANRGQARPSSPRSGAAGVTTPPTALIPNKSIMSFNDPDSDTDSGEDNEVDVMELRHHTFPLEDIVFMITRYIGEPLSDEEIKAKLQGNSFKFFTPDSCFRFWMAKIVSHPVFELFVMLVIVESCVALGFENDDSRADPHIDTFLTWNAYVLAVLFFIEAVMRSIAWGAFWGEGTYLSDNWNRIDFFVLLVSIVSIFIPEAKGLRSLRIFRLAAKITAMRTVISAVVSAMPGIGNVALLVIFIFVVFGILGVQLFKGTFVSCNDSSIQWRVDCVGNFNSTLVWFEALPTGELLQHVDVQVLPRRWEHDFFNFNHLGFAVLTLIQQMFSDGWSTVLYSAMDSNSYDQAKSPNATPVNALYFVVFIVVGNFFLINLFVGSLVDSFSHERNVSDGKIDRDGNPLLTAEQDNWIRTYRVLEATTLLPYISKAKWWPRRACQWIYFADEERLSPSILFEWIITGAILLNAILMCTTHDSQPDWWTETLFWANLAFAVIFFVEAVIKLIALLPRAYFADPWNRFDCLMVPTAFISLFLGGPGTNAIRVLRVARVLRLVKRAKGLKRLFDSLLYALPQLINIFMLLFLTLFVFGVIGTALFGDLLIDPLDAFPLNEQFNFQNAMRSMVLLFQISTTESWADVMRNCMMDETNSNCSMARGDCGSWTSIPFFIFFMFCANNVALNLFIFVIVDNYMEVNSMNDPRNMLLFHRLNLFRTSWSVLDREGHRKMRWDLFALVILKRVMRQTTDPQDMLSDSNAAPTKEQIALIRRELEAEEFEEAALDAGARKNHRSQLKASAAMEEEMGTRNVELQKSVIEYLMMKKEASFMRMLRRLEVPVDAHGMVRYHDCVFALTKEHYGLDPRAARKATKFLGLSRDRDPSTFRNCFKVHHALAVRHIVRLLRQRQNEARIKKRVQDMFTSGMMAGDDGDATDSSLSHSDYGNDPLDPGSPQNRASSSLAHRSATASVMPPVARVIEPSTPSNSNNGENRTESRATVEEAQGPESPLHRYESGLGR